MFKILGAKNYRKNLHKHPGPPFQIRGGPGSFSNAASQLAGMRQCCIRILSTPVPRNGNAGWFAKTVSKTMSSCNFEI